METGDLFWILCSFLECFWTHSMHSLIFVKERRKGGIKKKERLKKRKHEENKKIYTYADAQESLFFFSQWYVR